MAKSDTRKRFEERFRAEREAGNATFEFEGKTYSTKLAEEMPAKKVPMPTPRPKDLTPLDETPPAKSLSDFYKKYPDSLPEKYAPEEDTKSTGPQTEAQRVSRAIGDVRKSIRPNMSADEDAAAMAAIRRAREANIQAGNRADEAILPGSTYSRQTYKKGGMVKSKASSSKPKSGVRGAGIAVKGRGKMRMF